MTTMTDDQPITTDTDTSTPRCARHDSTGVCRRVVLVGETPTGPTYRCRRHGPISADVVYWGPAPATTGGRAEPLDGRRYNLQVGAQYDPDVLARAEREGIRAQEALRRFAREGIQAERRRARRRQGGQS